MVFHFPQYYHGIRFHFAWFIFTVIVNKSWFYFSISKAHLAYIFTKNCWEVFWSQNGYFYQFPTKILNGKNGKMPTGALCNRIGSVLLSMVYLNLRLVKMKLPTVKMDINGRYRNKCRLIAAMEELPWTILSSNSQE